MNAVASAERVTDAGRATVTVVVPTHRRVERLVACLDGLEAQTSPASEVLAIVHAADDATAAYVARRCRAWPELRLVTVEAPGLVAALNCGLRESTGTIVAFCDDDAVPRPDWLERMQATFAQDRRIAGVGGRDIVHELGVVRDGSAGLGGRLGGARGVGRIQWFGRMLGNHHRLDARACDTDVLKGVNMAFRRDAVIGHGFDERLRGDGAVVHTELSICLPVRRRGLRIVFDPAIVVEHYPAPRPHGDHRHEVTSRALAAATHNETLQILDHFGRLRRLVFLAWAVAVGTGASPGLAVLARDLATRSPGSRARFRAALHGRHQAWRTHRREPRSSAPGEHGRFRFALELAGPLDGLTVVDWGCAHGWFAARLADRHPTARVIACDIPYPHGAPLLPAPNAEFHLISEATPRLPVPDRSVDRLFALDVIEHMGPSSRPAALTEMRRILKPGGRLIVTVPHRGALHWTDVENVRLRFPRLHRVVFTLVRGHRLYVERYGSNRLANFSSDATEHHHFELAELDGILGAAGFTTVEHRFFGVAYLAPWLLSIALEPARRLTGRRLSGLERVAATCYVRSANAVPPPALAESVGVAAELAPLW